MKKILLLLLVTSLVSCKMLQVGDDFKPVSEINNQIEIGMTIAQFLAIAGERAEKDAMDETRTVYRVNQYQYNTLTSVSSVVDSMFYYFYADTGILYKVNAGVSNK